MLATIMQPVCYYHRFAILYCVFSSCIADFVQRQDPDDQADPSCDTVGCGPDLSEVISTLSQTESSSVVSSFRQTTCSVV